MTTRKTNLELTEKGIRAAKVYIKNKGYKVIDGGFKRKAGEADIISTYKNIVVFTSVTVHRNDSNRMPKEKITADQRQKIESVMASYLAEHPDLVDMEVR